MHNLLDTQPHSSQSLASDETQAGVRNAHNTEPRIEPLALYAQALAVRQAENRLRGLPECHPNLAGQSETDVLCEAFCDFSANDYLGLSRAQAPIAAAQAATAAFGTGSTGSRLICGNYALIAEFEKEIATSKQAEAALIFGSGFQANATVLATLLEPSVIGKSSQARLVYCDRLIHASLHEGCQSAGVKQIRFRHNDLAHLASLLERDADLPGVRVIVTEALFSMDGDWADVPALLQLAERYHALLYVDEAHAIGLYGEQGYGVSLHGHPNLVVMGAFGKALASSGAYVAASRTIIDYLLNFCPGFVYSTAPNPAAIGAAQAVWRVLPTLAESRATVLRLAEYLAQRLHAAGFTVLPHSLTQPAPIVPVVLGDDGLVVHVRNSLAAQGIRVGAIRPPTVPPGSARLRLTVHAGLSMANIDRLIHALVLLRQDWLATTNIHAQKNLHEDSLGSGRQDGE